MESHETRATIDEQRTERLQAANAVLLGLAAVATAFAGYRSAILGGDAIADYTRAARTVNESSQAFIEGNQIFALDQAVFLEYAKANFEGNVDLAVYYKDTLGSQQLSDAIDAWEADDTGLNSPFETAEYTIPQYDDGEALLAQTDELFQSGQQSDDRGDRFDLAVAIFATALFLYGISAVSRGVRVQYASLAFGTVLFAGGLVYMITI